MDQDQQQQQPQNNARAEQNEMAATVKEMRREQYDLENELHRQRALHEKERKKWYEERRKMQEERERLLNQSISASTSLPKYKSKFLPPKPIKETTSLHASSRLIRSVANRARNFNSLSEGFRKHLQGFVHKHRLILETDIKRHRQAVETDQATRALDTLSLSDQSKNTRTKTDFSLPPSMFGSQNLLGQDYLEIDGVSDFGEISKHKHMQYLLLLLMHTQKCPSNEFQLPFDVLCIMPCVIMNKVLKHMRTCPLVTRCPRPMCDITRDVMHHYYSCKTFDCSICLPAKQQSPSVQEQLLRYMKSFCKGLDEDVPVEASSIPNIVITPPSDSPMPFARQPEAQTQAEEASAEMKMDGSDMHE